MDNQIIWPTNRLLANPRIFQAIANHFEGPDFETFMGAFYDLLEADMFDEEDEDSEPIFSSTEVCFREKPDDPETFQVILSTGAAIELQPIDGEYAAQVQDVDDLNIVSLIYERIVRAIESERPDLKDNIALCDPPTPSNGYLRSSSGDAFYGKFHLLTDPDTVFKFEVKVVDLDADDLRATVERS